MQKKLIALAIAGLSGAAFAQSNVTVYGVADATYDFISTSSNNVSTQNQSYNRVSTNSSLIGFKGVEDLGNGMKAVFQYESAFGFDNSSNTMGPSRDSFVALAGGFGTVALGNLTGPTRAFGGAVDVNDGATGIGSNAALLGKLGNVLTGTLDTSIATGGIADQVVGSAANGSVCGRSSTCTSAWDTRYKNAIAYISPDMSGFTVIVGYVPNEGKSARANPHAYDLGLKYANGPLMVGLSHADAKLENNIAASTTSTVGIVAGVPAVITTTVAATTFDTHAQNTRLVGMYDFGSASIRGLWDKTKLEVNGGLNADQVVWGLGATFNATAAGKVLFQYYRAKDVNGNLGAADTGARLTELGYEHSLSKRTMVKATYARLANDKNVAYDYGINATGLAAGGNATLSGLQIGLRHKF